MAIRSGFALGLHREETLVIFGEEEQVVRRNLWRSLFVLDGFLAMSLGRPTSISEEDCSNEALKVEPSVSQSSPSYGTSTAHTDIIGLEASVRSCKVVGTILKKVYSKRKISTKLAQEIANQCESWPRTLPPSLHWRQMSQVSSTNAYSGIAILHVNLFYCHTVILLTRPFFLFLLNRVLQERTSGSQRPQRFGKRMETFSEACVSASCHSIVLVQAALDGNYLSRRNPFVLWVSQSSSYAIMLTISAVTFSSQQPSFYFPTSSFSSMIAYVPSPALPAPLKSWPTMQKLILSPSDSFLSSYPSETWSLVKRAKHEVVSSPVALMIQS
jgi:hypothetical protein